MVRDVRRFSAVFAVFVAVIGIGFGFAPGVADAQVGTLLQCGAPSVDVPYEANAELNEGLVVGGPMSCTQAEAVAKAMNGSSGCCAHPGAAVVKDRAELAARMHCENLAGENVACNIVVGQDQYCTDGCALNIRPLNGVGCENPADGTSCTGTASAVRTDQSFGTGEGCMVRCQFKFIAKAAGGYRASCTKCNGSQNCDGFAQAQLDLKAKLAELEKQKADLEARLAALTPTTPSTAALAASIVQEIVAIAAQINAITAAIKNVSKVIQYGSRIVRFLCPAPR